MKKAFLLTFLLAVTGSVAWAQPTITLLTFESYTFSDKFETDDGIDGKLEDGFQWGGGLEFGLNETMAVELIYQRLDTEISALGQKGDVSINYIMLGGTRYMPLNEKVSGFGSVDLGVGFVDFKEGDLENAEKFSWGARLGVRIAASEKVSLRLHGQLMSAVQAMGIGVGTGGVSAAGFSTIYQFNLGGSLNFRLK